MRYKPVMKKLGSNIPISATKKLHEIADVKKKTMRDVVVELIEDEYEEYKREENDGDAR